MQITVLKKLENAIRFTEIYKRYVPARRPDAEGGFREAKLLNVPARRPDAEGGFREAKLLNAGDISTREAMCLDFQNETIFLPLEPGALLAGRIEHGYVGFSLQYGGEYTYYYHGDKLRQAMEDYCSEINEDLIWELHAVDAFWSQENTVKKLNDAFNRKYGHEPAINFKGPGFYYCDARVAGCNLDFMKLMGSGLPGIEDELSRYDGENPFYKACALYIRSIRRLCERYALEAEALGNRTLAGVLNNIANRKPSTFYEGLQLTWLYAISGDLMNYGRMDDYLGRLYADDLDGGRMTEEEGISLILALYRRFMEVNKYHDCRVLIGGRGRKDPEASDRLAMAFMEASRRLRENVPQLTLRYYGGMSEAVFQKAMEVNGEGCTFPIIYSDDVNIPAIMKLYNVGEELAEKYVPYGCGEYVLEGLSTGTPNSGINLLKALEMTLHNGLDRFHNVRCGLSTGDVTQFSTFERLYAALLGQIEPAVADAANHEIMNYRIAGEEAAYLNHSILMGDCIGRGKPLLAGGVRYLNAATEIFGIISCADSLTAIRRTVFEEKRFTLAELVAMLDADFDGYGRERMILKNAPKYGNDDDYADEMAVKLFRDVGNMVKAAGKKAGLDNYAIVSVNNSMSAEWGRYCSASACGRKRSEALSNGNGPSNGGDRKGLTATLNSMSKFDHSLHAGVINNIRFDRSMFRDTMNGVKALLKTFFTNGGAQANLCVVNRGDMEDAMEHPEKYPNLMVRIGGFSARFITLSNIVQRELIERTTY
jgi:pyruvate-formate lyase